MLPVKRGLLLEDTIVHLRDSILRGLFSEELPSCRQLAEMLQISVPTLLRALERLVGEELLIRGKSRRPYRLAPSRPRVNSDAQERSCILLISSKPLHEYEYNTRMGVDRIIIEATHHGADFQHRVVSYESSKRPSRRWDEVLDGIRPTHLLAISGNPVLAEWACNRDVPTLFLGGFPGTFLVPTVGVSIKQRLDVALEKLFAAGHRHVCMPISGIQDSYIPAFHELFRGHLERHGLTFVPNYHAPSTSGRSAAATRAMLSNVFEARIPTAIIFTSWIDFIASIGLVAKHNLALARDITAILLNHDPGLDSYEPVPAHFEIPRHKLEKFVIDWIHAPRSPRFQKGGMTLLPSKFREGTAFRRLS